MSFSLRMEPCIRQEQSHDCAVCGEPMRSKARFTASWGLAGEQLVAIGVCPYCRSFPPAGGRDIPKLRAAWLAVERPATRPGCGLPFDLI